MDEHTDNDIDDALELSNLVTLARRYYPPLRLDVEPGYEDLPEVVARRQMQARAQQDSSPLEQVVGAVRARWPDARVMDFSNLALDTAWQLRIARRSDRPEQQLVVFLSIFLRLALVYESEAPIGRPPIVRAPAGATDGDAVRALEDLVRALGWQVLVWEKAQAPCPEIAVGNLLPGEATVADAFFSASRT